jgi:hypothetical protein
VTPMPAEAATWIREHAWTGAMRRQHANTPGAYDHCPCQYGPSGYCDADQHRRCHHQPDQHQSPTPETWICNQRSEVLGFRRWRYRHATDTITGRRRLATAAVWLADRRCVWHCPCDCHAPAGTQFDLFGSALPRPPRRRTRRTATRRQLAL